MYAVASFCSISAGFCTRVSNSIFAHNTKSNGRQRFPPASTKRLHGSARGAVWVIFTAGYSLLNDSLSQSSPRFSLLGKADSNIVSMFASVFAYSVFIRFNYKDICHFYQLTKNSAFLKARCAKDCIYENFCTDSRFVYPETEKGEICANGVVGENLAHCLGELLGGF